MVAVFPAHLVGRFAKRDVAEAYPIRGNDVYESARHYVPPVS